MDWWRKKFIIFCGFVEALIFSGCLFGWPSLLLVLQEEGVYRDVCNPNMLHETQTIRNHDDNSIKADNNSLGGSHRKLTTLLPSTNLLDSETQGNESVALTESHEGGKTKVNIATLNVSERICNDKDESYNCPSNLINIVKEETILSGCDEQRVQMTLIFTFAAVAYGITAVFIGLSLEWLGLRVTRLIGSTFGCLGFIFLAYTTTEQPYFLWPALNLIALGTNQLRFSGFQFADLWPEYRATILTAYSSAYSISTTFFLIIQMLYEQSIPVRIIFLCCGGICAVTYIPTFFMPTLRVIETSHRNRKEDGERLSSTGEESYAAQVDETEFDESGSKNNEDKDELALSQLQLENEDDQNQISTSHENFSTEIQKSNGQVIKATRTKYSVMSYVLSLSGILHMYWQFINLFLILFYSSTFNVWAARVTSDVETVSFFIKMSGVCCFIVPLFVPIIGVVTDKMIGRAEMRSSRIERIAYTMQAPTFAMAGATILLIFTMICKLFFTKVAIYVSLVLIAMSRPAVVGSCTAYIRLRFPSQHFNILNGIFTTVISIVCFVQYPIMKWMTSSFESYNHAHWLLLLLLVGSLASPLHMMVRKNIMDYAKVRLNQLELEDD